MKTPVYEDCPKCGFPMCEQQYPRQEVCRGHEEVEAEEDAEAPEEAPEETSG